MWDRAQRSGFGVRGSGFSKWGLDPPLAVPVVLTVMIEEIRQGIRFFKLLLEQFSRS